MTILPSTSSVCCVTPSTRAASGRQTTMSTCARIYLCSGAGQWPIVLVARSEPSTKEQVDLGWRMDLEAGNQHGPQTTTR